MDGRCPLSDSIRPAYPASISDFKVCPMTLRRPGNFWGHPNTALTCQPLSTQMRALVLASVEMWRLWHRCGNRCWAWKSRSRICNRIITSTKSTQASTDKSSAAAGVPIIPTRRTSQTCSSTPGQRKIAVVIPTLSWIHCSKRHV